MSGSGVKKVAEVAAKATKSIDWDGMAKLLVSGEARKEFANLRRSFDEVNHQLQTKFSQEPEPIDWEYYRKGIGSRLVDMYKQAYESKAHIPDSLRWIIIGLNHEEYCGTRHAFDYCSFFIYAVLYPQLVELKEAEKQSLEESARLEKEIAVVQEMKVRKQRFPMMSTATI
ncbi:hypothetical protein BHM03_00047134 [Ensete ventricosum]|nr:hypothetical protein BHM03_00047134 [Ensete ventricosum]